MASLGAFVFGLIVLCFSIFLAYMKFDKHIVSSSEVFWEKLDFRKKEVDLGICILSARNNSPLRQAIRQSWLSSIHDYENKNKAVAKFIVGSSDCPIHPQDRISAYGCQEWLPQIPANTEHMAAYSLKPDAGPAGCHLVKSLYVKIMHDVKLRSLGVAELLILDNCTFDSSLRISLFDFVTDEEITSVQFVSRQGLTVEGFIYKPIQELHLPKGYEFNLVVTLPVNPSLEDCTGTESGQIWRTEASHYQIVYIEMLDDDDTTLVPEPDTRYLSAASFMFSVLDKPTLALHIETTGHRHANWQDELQSLATRLTQEQSQFGDLLLVDLVDVYRNLPVKVLQCHTWLGQTYRPAAVLKTDDDCYLNLPAVLSSLSMSQAFSWWGNFRRNWPVERWGKWRETVYSSSVYPRFSCGSGYVVAAGVHQWIIQNQQLLQVFQGEDVSTGIWLSALNVHHMQDSRWQCAGSCRKDALSVPELNASMIIWHWNNSRACASPCSSC